MEKEVAGTDGTAVKKLGDVSHDGFIIGLGDVDILGVEEAGDSQFGLCGVEGGLQSHVVGGVAVGVGVDGVRLDAVDDGDERRSVPPTRTEIIHLHSGRPKSISSSQ